MLSEHEINQKMLTCKSITMANFIAKNNLANYEQRYIFEVRQFLSEFSEGILKITLGDDDFTLTELIEGQTQLLIDKFIKL
jgi:hypothetical protein